ncbi:hypothetical protein AVEN_230041-1 [Araneus ventricosus]|uniref:Uncharacterized protein n=1 Tax=Araneus ventricosus TaxID=182803 RepID=A0A4Y2CV85_ARAVE|nr:hypothetical protein AVEN_230041-1 [Araneus ventricosus]
MPWTRAMDEKFEMLLAMMKEMKAGQEEIKARLEKKIEAGQERMEQVQEEMKDLIRAVKEEMRTHVESQLRNVWFQHDCTPAHKTSSVKQYLVEEFLEQIIGYGGFQEWHPRTADLTPMDFFLWGNLKQQVYATSANIFDLQRCITDACANVTPAMQHRVQREVQVRVLMCIVADGEKFKYRK